MEASLHRRNAIELAKLAVQFMIAGVRALIAS
jgi:hypothetical protein